MDRRSNRSSAESGLSVTRLRAATETNRSNCDAVVATASATNSDSFETSITRLTARTRAYDNRPAANVSRKTVNFRNTAATRTCSRP